jgi:hypothetical protein
LLLHNPSRDLALGLVIQGFAAAGAGLAGGLFKLVSFKQPET